MGWGSGGDVFKGVWESVRPHVDEDDRVKVCREIIQFLEYQDLDDSRELICESDWPECKQALKELHPDWDWSDDGS